MKSGNHTAYPELWFRPTPALLLSVLYNEIASGTLTTSVRMGVRDARHPKGYSPGQLVTLRLFNQDDLEVLTRSIRISTVQPLRLRDIGPADVHALEFFEKRALTAQDKISIVTFEYLTTPTMNIEQLACQGLVVPATLPPNNGDITSSQMTMPLIAEDYPAKTAVMWNAAYATFGLSAQNVMVVADPNNVQPILNALRNDHRYFGGGAGIGFKEVVIPYLDTVTPLAKAVGAVNIIKKEDGILVGDNTDGEGYVRSLEEKLAKNGTSLEKAAVLMLGAGGSARGIGFALAKRNVRLTILNRTAEKAEELAQSINVYAGKAVATGGGRDRISSLLPSQDVVVSVIDDAKSPLDAYSTLGTMDLPITPKSIKENRASVSALLEVAKPILLISDIRIRNAKVPMLLQAEKLGFATLDGIGMVINQGAMAFWWLYGDTLSAQGVTIGDVEQVMRKVVQ